MSSAASIRSRVVLELTTGCEGYAVGCVGNVLFVSAKATTPASLDAAEQATRQMVERYPNGFAQLLIMNPGAPMPSPEARKRITVLNDRFGKHTRAMAMVLGGDSLWTSSMRVVANTMMMVMPVGHQRRMFGDLVSAVSWLVAQLGRNADFSVSDFAHFDTQLAAHRARRCADCICH